MCQSVRAGRFGITGALPLNGTLSSDTASFRKGCRSGRLHRSSTWLEGPLQPCAKCLHLDSCDAGKKAKDGDLLVRYRSPSRGAVAQLGERLVRNEDASGSIPLSSTKDSITYGILSIEFPSFCVVTSLVLSKLFT